LVGFRPGSADHLAKAIEQRVDPFGRGQLWRSALIVARELVDHGSGYYSVMAALLPREATDGLSHSRGQQIFAELEQA
jgi:hypothetical protein